jgi:hypothetical protein
MNKNVLYTNINLNNHINNLNGNNLRRAETSASNLNNQTSYVPIDESSLNVSRQTSLENGNKINKLGYIKSDKTNENSRKNHIQTIVYNFLERPNGWICFVYHFMV